MREKLNMKRLLAVEELFLFALAIYLFSQLEYAWWLFPALFFAPDVSIVAYAGGPKLGTAVYNIVHHRGLGLLVYLFGVFTGSAWTQLAGLIVFGHASFDRILGYGLKYPDAFKHTHLGWIGGSMGNRRWEDGD